MRVKIQVVILLSVFCFYSKCRAQTFKEIAILSDTSLFYYSHCAAPYLGDTCFFLKAGNAQQTCEITFYPAKNKDISAIQLLASSDVIIVDSLINFDNNYFRGKIKFKAPSHTGRSTLIMNIITKNGTYAEELKLFLYSATKINPANVPVELYAGEEKTIKIPVLNPANIRLPIGLIKNADYDYSITADDNDLNVLIHPNAPGNKELALNVKTIYPFLTASGKVSYDLPVLTIHFIIKPGRLNFVNTDQTDFFFDDKTDETEEIQIDQKKTLETGKIYRVENQLEPGGKLVAEMYVKSVIGDNKLLCSLRPYSYHKMNDGYLYIKQGNDAKCITNFNVLQKPAIENVSVLHEGDEWSSMTMVCPGENVRLKIEGKGLAKAKFQFSNCDQVKQDSTRVFDDEVFYSFHIPSDITVKAVYIEINGKKTKYELAVKENQHPKDFNFILINYGFQNVPLSSSLFNKPIVDPQSLKDINISFNTAVIDDKDEFYGKQYLDFEFKIYNSKNDLIEDQKLEDIAVCPDETSARGAFYNRKDCSNSIINVNDYLLHKTYELEGWSKVEIIVKDVAGKYTEPGYSRRIIIIKQKLTSLDLQASFPAGLLLKNFNSKGIGELSGLSIAFLAQMSFYEKDDIQKIKPYKVGAGIMALNIYNLTSSDSQPDIAAVVIGSVLPLKPDSKFNFPLYIGCGYMMKSGKWFSLLGPGVQFNF